MIDADALRQLGWSEELIAEVMRLSQAVEADQPRDAISIAATVPPTTVGGISVISGGNLEFRAGTSVIWYG